MSIRDDLKNTKGDYIHATVKAAIGNVPVVGGILSEAFGLVVTAPADKRKENIIIMLDERLREIEIKVDQFHLADLATNDQFLSTVLQVIQIAMRTHQTEKRVALINAVTNTAVLISIEENLQQMFINFIDSFNEWHLKLLHFLNDPKQQLIDNGLSTDFYTGAVRHVITSRFPELNGRDEFTNQIVNDLNSRGLINTNSSSLNGMMTGSGMIASRTTEMGKQFLLFITTPSFLGE